MPHRPDKKGARLKLRLRNYTLSDEIQPRFTSRGREARLLSAGREKPLEAAGALIEDRFTTQAIPDFLRVRPAEMTRHDFCFCPVTEIADRLDPAFYAAGRRGENRQGPAAGYGCGQRIRFYP